jgi:ribonucleoside-diphosphate reductase beta chain
MRNLLKGIGQQMKWSVRDESLHSKMGCTLFRQMCSEDNQLLNLCRSDVIMAAETMVQLEIKYIDKMFEMGDIEGISANDLKHFIKKRTNEKLVELGYVDLGSYFPYDVKAAANLDWFYHLTGGVTHTDFFAIRPTDYSKANEGEDFEDIW